MLLKAQSPSCCGIKPQTYVLKTVVTHFNFAVWLKKKAHYILISSKIFILKWFPQLPPQDIPFLL